jgi:hypothetical protein
MRRRQDEGWGIEERNLVESGSLDWDSVDRHHAHPSARVKYWLACAPEPCPFPAGLCFFRQLKIFDPLDCDIDIRCCPWNDCILIWGPKSSREPLAPPEEFSFIPCYARWLAVL